jgi:hypothetical protein
MPRIDPSTYLHQYVTERLPELLQGDFEAPGDPPSIAVDQRYIPFRDTLHHS